VRTPLKGLSFRNFFVLDTWSYAPVAYSSIQGRLYSMDQKFHGDDEKPENLDFGLGSMAHGHNATKFPKFKYKV
jgi:hypothetical protein